MSTTDNATGEAGSPRANGTAPSWRGFALVHGALQGLVLLLSLSHARDPDLGFHLATGRSILLRGYIPATNVLSFAEPDAPALHSQWLGAVVFELAFQALGIAGPTLVKCALLAITMAVLVETARKLGARPSATLLALSLAAYAASERFVERPLLFSNLALAVIAYAIASGAPCVAPGTGRRAGVLAVVALALTVHFHGGAVFGFLLLIATAALYLTAALHPSLARVLALPREDAWSHARDWALVVATGAGLAAASLFAYHPHAGRVLSVPFTMASDPFLHQNLVEFRPPHAFDPSTLVPYWILVALVVVSVLASIGRVPATVLLPMAFGLAISLRHVRFVDLLAFLAAPGLALIWSRAMTRGERVHGEAVALALSLCVLVASTWTVLERGDAGFGYASQTFPIALMRDARALGVTGPAFVQDGWAGPYLGFRFPEERAFFHPAFDFYTDRFFRESYMRTRDGEPGWDAILDRHGVRQVLMKYTSLGEARRQRGRPNLRQRLAADSRWALVSFDDYGLVFARREGLSPRAVPAIIEGLDPDRHQFLDDPPRASPGLRALLGRMQSHRGESLAAIASERTR